MGEWTITDEPMLLQIEDLPPYFYVVEDKKYARRGYLYKCNPPQLLDPYSRFNKKAAENLAIHTELVEHFGLGELIRPLRIRMYLKISTVKCFHVFQWLCSVNLAERYIAGVIRTNSTNHIHKDRTYGVHYLLKDESEQTFYGSTLRASASTSPKSD